MSELINYEFFELDQLEAFGCEIHHNVVFVRSGLVPGLQKDRALATALPPKRNVQLAGQCEPKLLGFQEVVVELCSFILSCRIPAMNLIEIPMSDGL